MATRRHVGRCLFAALLALGANALAFDLQAHRGGRGLLPENTLAAFENALALGVTTLELDIAITLDGVAVISHEPALNPALTRDANGSWIKPPGPLIKSLTLEQLQTYDVGRIDPSSDYARPFGSQRPSDGERIPPLAALFKLVRDRRADQVRFNIETKVFPDRPEDTLAPDVFVDVVLRAIVDAGMRERVTIQSFDWRTLQRVQQREPAIETVYLTMQFPKANNLRDGSWTAGLLLSRHASVAHMVKASGGATWSPDFQHVDAAAVKTAHALGLKVIPWTVNEDADMDRLIAWGADGLISDYPQRLRAAMQRAGLDLPPALPP